MKCALVTSELQDTGLSRLTTYYLSKVLLDISTIDGRYDMTDTDPTPDLASGSGSGWKIRPADESDIDETVPFIDNARRSLFHKVADSPVPPDLARFKETFIDGPGHFLVARTNMGRLIAGIGYRQYDHRFPHLEDRNYRDTKTVEVVRLFVSPEYRRSGLAGTLFKELLSQAKKDEVRCMYLHTHRFLPGAITFWERQGFTVVDVEDDPVWQTVHMDMRL